MLSPFHHFPFRVLWAGMGFSYAGDRLQELAQGWLIATLTGSALAVGTISILSAIPMFLMPLSGVISERADRRKILLTGQIAGAILTGTVAVLALTHHLQVWHIYLWAFFSGVIWLMVRPAYKVFITEAVPSEEVRQAVSINSITETSASAVMQAGGSAVLANMGVVLGFILNAVSYLIAATCLILLGKMKIETRHIGQRIQAGKVFRDLWEGLKYLGGKKELLYPLLLTLLGSLLCSPVSVLLAAIVKEEKGSIITLGIIGTALSIGALLGALFAGMRSEGDPMRTYPWMGFCAALLIGVFVFDPTGIPGIAAAAGLGFLTFAQAVWNTSRVPRLAEPEYQARLQSLSTMVFTLGPFLGALWGGLAFDRFGIRALLISPVLLTLISASVLIRKVGKR